MSIAADKVIAEALDLPVDARIGVVDRILESLNPPPDPALDALWAQEAERRVSELDRGEATLIPGEEVFARLLKNAAK